MKIDASSSKTKQRAKLLREDRFYPEIVGGQKRQLSDWIWPLYDLWELFHPTKVIPDPELKPFDLQCLKAEPETQPQSPKQKETKDVEAARTRTGSQGVGTLVSKRFHQG